MREFRGRWTLAALVLSGSTLFLSGRAPAAEPMPRIAPAPAWVKAVPIPQPDVALKESPAQLLLINTQVFVNGRDVDTYVEYVITPQSLAGMQGSGTVTIPWNIDRADLVVNTISIIRGSQVIDLLKNANFTVLRREKNLGEGALDGIRTVVLPTSGLQLGDQIRVGFTYDGKVGAAGEQAEDLQKWDAGIETALVERRLIVAPGSSVEWKASPGVPKPHVSKLPDGTTEYLFRGVKLAPIKYPKNVRAQDKVSIIQLSGYGQWSKVAELERPGYDAARKIADGSPLAREADRIAASTPDPAKRMLAALRLAQEQVRYVALLLGEGAYRPVVAAETWELKFGDCKGKTALLLGLLDRLGIEADPLYVLSDGGEVLGGVLPGRSVFDHVIARARIGGKIYYLDATDYGQRALADVAGSELGYGLPLVQGATLYKLPIVHPQAPTRESELVWDGSQGLIGEIPFAATLVLRGPSAMVARAKKITVEKPTEFDDYLKDLMPGIANDRLEIVTRSDDEASGEYRVTFKGKDKLDWDEYQDLKGLRVPFSNAAVNWESDFDRKEGPFKDLAVSLSSRLWQRETETIVLPLNAKGAKIDSTPLDKTVAATRIWRTVTMDGNRLTSVANFRHLEAEISADEARRAEKELELVNENWAYVIAPKGLKVPREKK